MRLNESQARRAMVALHFGGEAIRALDPVSQVVAHVRSRGCIQFDPLDVVGRNPDLVLQSRIENYTPQYLAHALYDERRLVDGFDKNLAIFPVEDFPYFRRMRDIGWGGFTGDPAIHASLERVLCEVERRGALCSDDLGMNEKVRWPWGMTTLSRASLETLWLTGRLALHHKKGTRRYYDLIERHLPGEVLCAPDPNACDEDYYKWRVLRRVRGVGMLWNRGSDAYLGIAGMKKPERDRAFQALEEDGAIEPVEVEGVGGLYVATADAPRVREAADREPEQLARVIAPLDNLLWDRKLIEDLFHFRYRWEVYVPVDKRAYGYYVLPVMLGDHFIARFEPAPWRGGALAIKNWWWEGEPDARTRTAADDCMARFEAYLKRRSMEDA